MSETNAVSENVTPVPPPMAGDEQVIRIPFFQLVPSPTNPRKSSDAKQDAELAASIKENYAHGGPGILEPLLCRRIEGEDKYEVVAGNRRLKAAQKADLDDAPCIVRPMTDAEAKEVQIIENLQRLDVSTIDEARGLAELAKTMKVDAIAKKIGKSGSYVYQCLKICELGAKGQKLMEEGKLPAGHAFLIARLPEQAQERALQVLFPAYLREQTHPREGVRWLADWIKNNLVQPLEDAPFLEVEGGNLVDRCLVRGFEGAPGPCATCPKMSKNNAAFKDLKGNVCTDLACYRRKIEAFIEKTVGERAAGENGLIVLLNEYNHTPAEKDATELHQGQFSRATKPYPECKLSVPGIWKDGSEPGKIEEICLDPKCPVHGRSRAPRVPAKAKKENPLESAIEARALGYAMAAAFKKTSTLDEPKTLKAIFDTIHTLEYIRVSESDFKAMKGEFTDLAQAALYNSDHRKEKKPLGTKELRAGILFYIGYRSPKEFNIYPSKYRRQADFEIKAEAAKAKGPKSAKPEPAVKRDPPKKLKKANTVLKALAKSLKTKKPKPPKKG